MAYKATRCKVKVAISARLRSPNTLDTGEEMDWCMWPGGSIDAAESHVMTAQDVVSMG